MLEFDRIDGANRIRCLFNLGDVTFHGGWLVHRIARQFYNDTPDGIIGNEDAGQMSAWHIFATLGFYPAQPASGTYVVGLPMVRRATIDAPGKPRLSIILHGSGDRLKKLSVNGDRVDSLALPHEAIASGGTIGFTLGP